MKPGPSLANLVTPAFRAAVKDQLRLDTWIHAITGLGGASDKSRGAQIYGFRRLLPLELDALYHGEDLPAIIVNRLPEDALGRGFGTGDPALDQALGRRQAIRALTDARIWGRLYGFGAIYLGLSDRCGPQDQPADLRAVKRGDLRFTLTLDRMDVSIAEYRGGEPEIYQITAPGSGLSARIHASRLIVFGGARTSWRQRQANEGFDLSVLQRCQDALRDTDQTWRAVMNLLQDMSQAVFKIKGLVSMIADGRKDVVLNRMEVVNMARSIARAVVIDADGEDFSHVGAQNLSGVEPLLVRSIVRLATAAEMPVTVLAGVSPSGMNATGDGEIRIWYKRVTREREDIEPQCMRLASVIARTEGLEPPTSLDWPSLWEPTETEIADLDAKRAGTDKIRIDAGVLDAQEARVMWITGDGPESLSAEPALPELGEGDMLDPAPALPSDFVITDGSLWTDTKDGHQIKVTGQDSTRVYAVDLDSSAPAEQFAWVRRVFLERCQPRPDGDGEASA